MPSLGLSITRRKEIVGDVPRVDGNPPPSRSQLCPSSTSPLRRPRQRAATRCVRTLTCLHPQAVAARRSHVKYERYRMKRRCNRRAGRRQPALRAASADYSSGVAGTQIEPESIPSFRESEPLPNHETPGHGTPLTNSLPFADPPGASLCRAEEPIATSPWRPTRRKGKPHHPPPTWHTWPIRSKSPHAPSAWQPDRPLQWSSRRSGPCGVRRRKALTYLE